MKMRMDWMVNVVKRVPRRNGPASRVLLLKVVAPRKKAIIEIRDLSQPQGLLVGWEEAPRPRKIVFPIITLSALCIGRYMCIEEIPVCMARKHVQAL